MGIEGVRAVSRGYKGKGGKKKKRKRRKAEIGDDIFSILIKMLCTRMTKMLSFEFVFLRSRFSELMDSNCGASHELGQLKVTLMK